MELLNHKIINSVFSYDDVYCKIIHNGLTSILIIIGISLYYLYFVSRKRNLPPGPNGIPFLGYFPFLGDKPYETVLKLSKKYGNVFSIYVGPKLVVILNDWESVKEALGKTAISNRPEGFFDLIPNGLGLGGVNGAEWVEQRRFTVKTMKDIGFGRTRWEELVHEELDDVIQLIKRHDSSPIDVRNFFAFTFANNVMTLSFGQRLPMSHPDTELASQCIDAVSNSLPALGLNNYLPTFSYLLTKLGLTRQSLTIGKILAFSNLISRKIEEQKKRTDNEKNAFVDEYMEEMKRVQDKTGGHYFSDRNLSGNTQALLLGGSETTRTTLNFVLIAMAEHPEEQKKVHAELDNVLGKDGRIRWGDRMKVPYTYAVIMESMRWKTVIPINAVRTPNEDIQISGYDVPKDVFIIGNFWALHNDPKYWSNPEKFIPERFLLDDGKQKNLKHDSYVPFSFGKRSCPGELIANMEVLLYFVTLMQNFQVLPESGPKVKYDTILGLSFQATNAKLRFIQRE